uniref:Uncharacterized protein n=1 Tax=Stomoxys calcitrans TaxID=35570 RepID=A0A1I8Q940_STOCA
MKILTITLITFVIIFHSPATNAMLELVNVSSPADADIQDAKQFSESILIAIRQYILYELPPEANEEAEVILAQIKRGLNNCESLLQAAVNIWEYKQCASALRRDAMTALATLQYKYQPNAASSATRISFLR